jgi:molecular chaperone GrpE
MSEDKKPEEKKVHGADEQKKAEQKVEQKLEQKLFDELKLDKEAQKIKDLEDRLLRLQAEFENHRKRSEKEHAELSVSSKGLLITELLSVVEQFELALAHEKAKSEFRAGMEMIYKNLLAVLSKEGLKEMDCLGKPFDPYYHEAVRQTDGEDGKVIEVIHKGYLFRGKVLRHAKVTVGNGNHTKKEEKKEEKK